MKFLTLILAIITLASVPCSNEINETANTIQTENDSEHSDDECTPLCICACCGITIYFEVLVFENEQLNTLISRSFKYKNLFTQSFITSIWHPPVIS